MIVDSLYFKGKLNVPGLNIPNSTRVGNTTSLQTAIDENELELMRNCLGSHYDEFLTQFKPNGDIVDTPIDKWKKFIEGEAYSLNGIDLIWRGLRYTEGAFKKSLVANYVFAIFMENYNAKLGGLGVQTEDSNNAQVHSSIPIIVESWNKFVQMYQGSVDSYGPAFVSTSRGLTYGLDYAAGSREASVSLKQYLLDRPVDFPDVNIKLYESMNSFGI